jgi:hypothetical protein
VRRRRFKRRLFWTALIVALLVIWLIAQVLRAAEATAAAARSAFRAPRGSQNRRSRIAPWRGRSTVNAR